MALINIETAPRDAIRQIDKAQIDSGIEIMSYKRNRFVALIRLSNQLVLLREQGYVDDDTEVDLKQLSKKSKTALLSFNKEQRAITVENCDLIEVTL